MREGRSADGPAEATGALPAAAEAPPVAEEAPARRRDDAWRARSVDAVIVVSMAVIAVSIVIGSFAALVLGRALPEVVWTIPAATVGAFGGALGARSPNTGP